MSGIVWEEPPADGRGECRRITRWDSIADALRERPGEWARIYRDEKPGGKATNARTLAYRINRGVPTAFRPAGAFEALARKLPDGFVCTFARYVGEAES